ncbi:MAG: AAA family ATPase [Planctomycetaceae bacterium]|jgi:ABC-type sulfate/molybdate transport systems ATPase subunit|nr:AAA family ATPase [Planctomycetaceae bacterium]
MVKLIELRDKLNRKKTEYSAYKLALQSELENYINIKTKLGIQDKANIVIRDVSQHVQRTIHNTVSDLVSRCLQAVFGEEAYEFRIAFEQKRNKIEAEMQFIRNGQIYDPMTQVGGGVLDVAAFGARLSALLLRQSSQSRRVLLLDEPFRFLSVEYRPKIRLLLETLAKELDFQFIIVTHIRELEIGDVITI